MGQIPSIPRLQSSLKSAPQPPRSEFGSIDPSPAAPETTLAGLRERLMDAKRPMFERFQAVFGLRALNTDQAAIALGDALLADRSALLRHECAYVLGQMQRIASIPQLVHGLKHDPNPMVRHEAAEALGAIGTDEVLAHLREALAEDPALEVRESCQVALDHAAYLRDPNQL